MYVTADRAGTEAWWFLEVVLEHWSERCTVRGWAGFQADLGTAELRETNTIVVDELEDLGPSVGSVLGLLFADLEQDLRNAAEADHEDGRLS